MNGVREPGSDSVLTPDARPGSGSGTSSLRADACPALSMRTGRRGGGVFSSDN